MKINLISLSDYIAAGHENKSSSYYLELRLVLLEGHSINKGNPLKLYKKKICFKAIQKVNKSNRFLQTWAEVGH